MDQKCWLHRIEQMLLGASVSETGNGCLACFKWRASDSRVPFDATGCTERSAADAASALEGLAPQSIT